MTINVRCVWHCSFLFCHCLLKVVNMISLVLYNWVLFPSSLNGKCHWRQWWLMLLMLFAVTCRFHCPYFHLRTTTTLVSGFCFHQFWFRWLQTRIGNRFILLYFRASSIHFLFGLVFLSLFIWQCHTAWTRWKFRLDAKTTSESDAIVNTVCACHSLLRREKYAELCAYASTKNFIALYISVNH